MKGTLLIAIIVIFCMLVIPLSALQRPKDASVPTANTQNNINYEPYNADIYEKIKVLNGDKITEYSVNDYLFGVVAAEMPALYEEEAIKAQTVAAFTFVCYKKNCNGNSGYDISTEAQTAQCFITREEAATRWGEKSQEYTAKLDRCIASVLGQTITHNNQIILAAYHAISPGKTNTCKDVWGEDLPYLQSVSSSVDTLAENYITTASFSADEIAQKLKSFTEPMGEAKNYFTDIINTDTGYVKSLKYCGKEISGSEIRNALELRSCNFEINFSENVFTFTVKGYGHGVGMSQNGANAMAKQGKTYQEILLHYYPGTTLQKILK